MRPSESFFWQPVRSLQTMLRVIAEDDRSLPTLIPDGIYGPSTMIAVTAFQRKYGLPVTGIADEETWDRIVAVYEPALVRVGTAEPIEILLEPGQVILIGERNPYIYLLQAMLAQLSYDHSNLLFPGLSGVLDIDTAESLRAFQALAGLPVTGTLDRVTWKHLVRQYSLNAAYNNSSGKS